MKVKVAYTVGLEEVPELIGDILSKSGSSLADILKETREIAEGGGLLIVVSIVPLEVTVLSDLIVSSSLAGTTLPIARPATKKSIAISKRFIFFPPVCLAFLLSCQTYSLFDQAPG